MRTSPASVHAERDSRHKDMWKPDTSKNAGPVYLAIADSLARDVASGRLEPGEKLPTHRELSKRLGLNVMTVTRAFAEAARRGLVEAEVGRGTFVRRRASVEPLAATAGRG